VMRGAGGRVIKDNPRVLMIVKGTNLMFGRVKPIRNGSAGSKCHNK